MSRTPAELPAGTRLTDLISLGVLAARFPLDLVERILAETGRQSQRQRQLPAQLMVYYVIALALYMQVSYGEVLRCLVEGLHWLGLSVHRLRNTSAGGISRARLRLGVEPLKRLYEETVGPVAEESTRGAWYRGHRLVSLDGTTLETADTEANTLSWGRPGSSRGQSAYPQLRLVSLVENGTHVLFGTTMGPYSEGENTLARSSVAQLKSGMLCLADRGFYGFELWNQARGQGADLLWRVKKNQTLPVLERFEDGSYLSKIYPRAGDRRRDRHGVEVRVIEYQLDGIEDAEPLYRLITTLLDPEEAPAEELAALYHERWEIETAFDELKTHLKGRKIILRSKTPELVRQELYGLLLAHFAVRGLMHEAALRADLDPDVLSFVHAVRVVRRKLPAFTIFPPSGPPSSLSGRPGRDPRRASRLQPGTL